MPYQPELEWERSVMRAFREDVADAATPGLLDDTLVDLLETLNPTEAFGLGKALSQIQRTASRALSDPTVRQVAQVALPAAGGAVGTLVGGPLGTTIGARLGGAVAAGLPGTVRTAPAQPMAPVATEPPAALKGLVLTQQPAVLTGLLAAALGKDGRQTVNGVPVAAVLSTLSKLFGQAAAEADALVRAGGTVPAFVPDSDELASWAPADRTEATYQSLLASESQDVEEVWP